MATTLRAPSIGRQAILHGLAIAATLAYAWFVSSTSYVTSAVQFVSPLAIIISIHILWLAVDCGYTPGFSRLVLARSLRTAFILMVCVAFTALIAPLPAKAKMPHDGMFLDLILFVIGCLAVVVAVVFIVGSIGNVILRLFSGRADASTKDNEPPTSKLNDLATLAIALGSVFVLSLEGVTQTLSFSASESAVSSYVVKADTAQVWKTAATATSPDFSLPAMLRAIPQPVKILTDEGVDLGAERVVLIAGREGSGELSMQIVNRTNTEATFKVISDTSPVSMWIAARSLTFRIEPIDGGTQLSVLSEYDRLLAPAWFFKPFMGVAAHLAVDTLARDIVKRAEAK